MKRILPLVLVAVAVAVVVAVRLRSADDDGENGDGFETIHPPTFTAQGKWMRVEFPNKPFRLHLPAAWWHHGTYGHGEIFKGPKDDGFDPNVHLYWIPNTQPFEAWYRNQRSKHMGGGARIINEGRASTAGMSGYFLTYEIKTKLPTGDTIVTITKDWLFDGGKRKGLLRGISTVRTFMDPYHALFNEIQKRLTRKP